MTKEPPPEFSLTGERREDKETQPYVYPENAVGETLRTRVTMIVPTRGTQRGVSGDDIIRRWSGQSLMPIELIIVRGAVNPAVGRNAGAQAATGDVLLFIDDDGQPVGIRVIEDVIGALLADESVWLAGAAIRPPLEASKFHKRYCRQVGLITAPAPETTQDSDLTTTLCCAMRQVHFKALGGFDGRLTAGEDPELRDRIRRAGGRIVLAAGATVYHPPSSSWAALWRRGFWYGRGGAQQAMLYCGEEWRRESQARGVWHYLIKGLASPISLIMDWESLKGGKVRLACQPLRMVHTWANAAGYFAERLAGGDLSATENAGTVERYIFPKGN